MTTNTRPFLTLALLSLLLLTACKKGDPLPGGYAIFFADSEDVGLVLPPKGEILVGPTRAGGREEGLNMGTGIGMSAATDAFELERAV